MTRFIILLLLLPIVVSLVASTSIIREFFAALESKAYSSSSDAITRPRSWDDSDLGVDKDDEPSDVIRSVHRSEPSPSALPTALVWVGNSLNECSATRLDHLLQTVPDKMDVWIMHDSNNSKEMKYLRILQEKHIFYVAHQHVDGIQGGFDGLRSGSSKSSFLKWLVQHKEYQYAWLVEDDVIFTGEWRELLQANHTDSDFVGSFNNVDQSWYWFGHDLCNMDPQYIVESSTSRLSSKPILHPVNSSIPLKCRVPCVEHIHRSGLWTLVRVSRRWANYLLEDFEKGYLRGHHEAAVFALQLAHKDLTYTDLCMIGANIAGGWGPWAIKENLALDSFPHVKNNSVYHPVKCEAYASPHKMDKLRKQLKLYGWIDTSSFAG